MIYFVSQFTQHYDEEIRYTLMIGCNWQIYFLGIDSANDWPKLTDLSLEFRLNCVCLNHTLTIQRSDSLDRLSPQFMQKLPFPTADLIMQVLREPKRKPHRKRRYETLSEVMAFTWGSRKSTAAETRRDREDQQRRSEGEEVRIDTELGF